MAFADELLKHLRCLAHGERGPHGSRGGSQLASFGEDVKKLSFLVPPLVWSPCCKARPLEQGECDRHHRAADQGKPPEAREGSQEDAYRTQDKDIQGGLRAGPKGHLPFWGRALHSG